jgi:hypothetical protein
MCRLALPTLACLLIVLVLGTTAGTAAPVSLIVPHGTAFSILGRSCGGIQEQAFATGFDPASGFPTGAVYLQTRCGGSGRGGGYHTTTYSAWVGATWDFGGGVLNASRLAAAPTVDPTLTVTDANGDQLVNSLNRAYLTVQPPAAPPGVTAAQVGDTFQVSWTTTLANPTVVTSSTITATPIGSTAPTVTTTVSGSAGSGAVGPLQPQTTYQITVVSTDAGGSSPSSSPISATTQAASVAPSAPAGVTARWTAPGSPGDQLVAT